MKKFFLILMAIAATMTVTSCKCCSSRCKNAEPADTECCTAETVTPVDVIEKYLVDVIAPGYTPGEFSTISAYVLSISVIVGSGLRSLRFLV